MGTSANLTVFQGDRHLVLHTSYDGYPSNVLPAVVAPLIAGGLDNLRKNFAAATIVPEDQANENDARLFFRENAAAYIEACESRDYPAIDLEAMLHYDYGIPDFAHAGGGLLFGSKHIEGDAWCGNPRQESDFILDLDAGTLKVNYGGQWAIDLAALADKDPDAVCAILSEYDYEVEEEDLADTVKVYGSDMKVASAEQAAAFSKALNDALAATPVFEHPPIGAVAQVVDNDASALDEDFDPTARGARGVATNQKMIYRFHPDDFLFVRLTSQAFQQTARATQSGDWIALVEGMKIERAQDHVGLFLDVVPARLARTLEAVGERLVANFAAVFTAVHPSGGISVRHQGGGYASSGSIGCFGGDDDEFGDEGNGNLPNPNDLSDPFTFERRAEVRQEWIDDLLGGNTDEALKSQLRGERMIALVALDPDAYKQILGRSEVADLLDVAAQDDQGLGEIAAGMAQIEAIFNQGNMRQRWDEFPGGEQLNLLAKFDVLGRRQFEGSLGLPSRRPKGP